MRVYTSLLFIPLLACGDPLVGNWALESQSEFVDEVGDILTISTYEFTVYNRSLNEELNGPFKIEYNIGYNMEVNGNFLAPVNADETYNFRLDGTLSSEEISVDDNSFFPSMTCALDEQLSCSHTGVWDFWEPVELIFVRAD